MRRIEKRTSSAIFLLLMGFAISAIAEPKMLVCETTAEAEERRLRNVAEEYKASNSVKAQKQFNAYADMCKDASYGLQFNFIFDTKGFNNAEFSNVEVQRNYLCGFKRDDVLKGTMEATPTIITFQWATDSRVTTRTFNVARKNLTGGYDTERNYTCVLSDIDTSENLL